MLKPKEVKKDTASVGVIIGRFQTDELHSAHIGMIDYVMSQHKKVIILLGVIGLNPVPATKKDPLDFETRRLMIHELYPTVIVSYVKDMKYDESWTKQVDSKINDLIAPGQSVELYGSRDSFIPYYKGIFPVTELEPEMYVSATIRRNEISLQTLSSKEFRTGAIYSINNQFDMPQTTVDIIIYKKDKDEYSILLGRKEYEYKYQFVGGFTTVESLSFEDDARREVWEEVGMIEISPLKYFCSQLIDDWRYRSQKTKIKTIVYYTEYLSGIISPADDIVGAKWFKASYLSENVTTKNNGCIIDGHTDILIKFLEKINKGDL